MLVQGSSASEMLDYVPSSHESNDGEAHGRWAKNGGSECTSLKLNVRSEGTGQ